MYFLGNKAHSFLGGGYKREELLCVEEWRRPVSGHGGGF